MTLYHPTRAMTLCPRHNVYFSGQCCAQCGRDELRATLSEHVRKHRLVMPADPYDDEADALAMAVADLNDELAGERSY